MEAWGSAADSLVPSQSLLLNFMEKVLVESNVVSASSASAWF